MVTKNKSQIVFKNSQFLHLFEKNEAYCLWHSLSFHKVYGGKILQQLFEEFKNFLMVEDVVNRLSVLYPGELIRNTINDFIDKGLLISSYESDLKLYTKLFRHAMNMYKIQNMYFLPTSACNLRCKYCFVEDDNRKFQPVRMTWETAKKGIDIFAKLTENAEKISLTFYGGEPLLNTDIVYSSMRYVRKLEDIGAFTMPVEMTLLTNGILIDKQTTKIAKETKTNISVSIDGPECYHDSARIDVKGNNTFERVLAGINLLHSEGISVGVSCTLNKYNIEHIEEVTNFIVNELKPIGMGFNILLPMANSGNPLNAPYDFTSSQLIAAFKILRDKGIYEDRTMRRVKPYIENFFHYKDCMGVGGQVVLSPDGRIGPCQAFLGFDEYFPFSVNELHKQLSTLTSEDIYKEPLFNEWCQRFPLNMKGCADCFAIGVCGGGCPYASHANHGSIWEIDDRVCFQSKQILEWMLWETYDYILADQESELVDSN